MSKEPEEIVRRDEKSLKPRQTLLSVALWILSALLSALDWVALRAAITAVAAVIVDAVPMEWQVEHQWYLRWMVRAADPCSMAVLTVLAFVTIIGFDPLYRSAVWKGTIRKTFTLVTGIQVGILALSWLVVTLMPKL